MLHNLLAPRMKNVLIVAGHAYPEVSVANREIVRLLAERYPGAVVDDLASLYPDYRIDAAAEQAKLEAADAVIVQSPVFWYSPSSLVKRWVEEVLAHGWAYGSRGHALDGKEAVLGLTAGAPDADYAAGGRAGITPAEIAKPYGTTFGYCRMRFLGTVFTGGMSSMGGDPERVAAVRSRAKDHADRIAELVGRQHSFKSPR